MDDNRAVSRPFFDKLLKGGVYHPFIKFVKEHSKELVLCFRGNGDPENIVIYYNNQIVWVLYGNEDKIGISFNHARYCEDWWSLRDNLGDLGFVIEKNGKTIEPNQEGSIGMLYCMCSNEKYKKNPDEFVEKSYKILEKMMQEYFEPKGKIDYDFFKNKYTDRKSNLTEKRWQQKLFNDLKKKETGLFTYDLEFEQPHGIQTNNTNEPDMLAIRYEEGEPKAIVLVEVKSTYEACTPKYKSDIISHLDGMKKYANENVNKKSLDNRRKEASQILSYYRELGLYVDENQIIPDENNILPIECVIIFTTADLIGSKKYILSSKSAIHYYLLHKEEINELVEKKDWKCSVLLIGEFKKNRRFKEQLYNYPQEWK